MKICIDSLLLRKLVQQAAAEEYDPSALVNDVLEIALDLNQEERIALRKVARGLHEKRTGWN